jgi:hypothetical protein
MAEKITGPRFVESSNHIIIEEASSRAKDDQICQILTACVTQLSENSPKAVLDQVVCDITPLLRTSSQRTQLTALLSKTLKLLSTSRLRASLKVLKTMGQLSPPPMPRAPRKLSGAVETPLSIHLGQAGANQAEAKRIFSLGQMPLSARSSRSPSKLDSPELCQELKTATRFELNSRKAMAKRWLSDKTLIEHSAEGNQLRRAFAAYLTRTGSLDDCSLVLTLDQLVGAQESQTIRSLIMLLPHSRKWDEHTILDQLLEWAQTSHFKSGFYESQELYETLLLFRAGRRDLDVADLPLSKREIKIKQIVGSQKKMGQANSDDPLTRIQLALLASQATSAQTVSTVIDWALLQNPHVQEGWRQLLLARENLHNVIFKKGKRSEPTLRLYQNLTRAAFCPLDSRHRLREIVELLPPKLVSSTVKKWAQEEYRTQLECHLTTWLAHREPCQLFSWKPDSQSPLGDRRVGEVRRTLMEESSMSFQEINIGGALILPSHYEQLVDEKTRRNQFYRDLITHTTTLAHNPADWPSTGNQVKSVHEAELKDRSKALKCTTIQKEAPAWHLLEAITLAHFRSCDEKLREHWPELFPMGNGSLALVTDKAQNFKARFSREGESLIATQIKFFEIRERSGERVLAHLSIAFDTVFDPTFEVAEYRCSIAQPIAFAGGVELEAQRKVLSALAPAVEAGELREPKGPSKG